jgi:hypothetical protein
MLTWITTVKRNATTKGQQERKRDRPVSALALRKDCQGLDPFNNIPKMMRERRPVIVCRKGAVFLRELGCRTKDLALAVIQGIFTFPVVRVTSSLVAVPCLR